MKTYKFTKNDRSKLVKGIKGISAELSRAGLPFDANEVLTWERAAEMGSTLSIGSHILIKRVI